MGIKLLAPAMYCNSVSQIMEYFYISFLSLFGKNEGTNRIWTGEHNRGVTWECVRSKYVFRTPDQKGKRNVMLTDIFIRIPIE
jgi:hypothetical protein